MIESELHPRQDVGPPVLLKRLGNIVEANLARARLESAGIPSFLGAQDVFSGGALRAGNRHGVEIFVPADFLHDALDVLETPPDEAEPFLFEPVYENPGRKTAFRALVTAVIGWLVIVMHPIGAFLSIPLFLYVLYLAYLANSQSHERDVSLRVRVVVAVLVSVIGIGVTLFLLADLLGKL